jgi:c-di-GMP-binding flagellar brake protein YcgR
MIRHSFQGETTAESRRYPRIPLRINLQYRVLVKGKPKTFHSSRSLAEDFGAKGLAMRSRHQLEPGQLLTMLLFIPPEDKRKDLIDASIYPEAECLKISVLARAAWCKTVGEDRFMVGVEFLDLESQDRDQLKCFLIDYELDDMNSPLYT